VCHTIERIPAPPADVRLVPAKVEYDDHGVIRDYVFKNDDGTPVLVPEFDPVLEDFVGRHKHDLSDVDGMQAIKVFPVDPATWEKMDVVSQLKQELLQVTGEFYEESDHYRTEALKCYNAHGNPALPGKACADYCEDSRRIGPKVPPKYQTYLCHVCPYMQTYVAQEMRHKAGLYVPETAARWRNSRRVTPRKR
jgi:hypothetical protein